MVAGKNTIEIIFAARDRASAAFVKVKAQMQTLGASTGKLNTGLGSLRSSFTNLRGSAGKLGAALGPLGLAAVAVAATVAIASLGVAAVRSFAEFEDAMASVRKTTGFTKSEIKVLGDAINDMALRIPVAQTELAGIAAVAGQLGIQGKGDILSFTETVAMMSTAFDMSAESVAIAMAKLGNIYNIPIEQTSNLGSAINTLGNTTAASESQIMAFSMALGPTAQQLGFAATEAISLGASMISIGMDASAAGTRLNRAFSMIGQNLDELAKFMGVTTEEFTQSFENMPMDTFMAVLEKLSQVEGKLKANTIASELFNEIGAKAIKGLTGDLDGLRTNLVNSKKGFEENTSLTEEFAAKTDTLNAKFAIFGNTVESFKIKIGGALAPLTGKLTEVATAAVAGLGLAFDGLMKIAGPAFDLLTIKFQVLKAFSEGLFGPIIAALAPLKESFDLLQKKLTESTSKLSLLTDIFTIITGAAKWLGEAIGTLVSMALTPLVTKLKEGIDLLANFYDKLGPIKGALEWVGEGVNNVAESYRAAKPPIEEVAVALEVLAEKGPKAPKAIADAWALAIKDFQDGAGTYKDAIGGIEEKIAELTEEWMTATDERKGAIDREMEILEAEKDTLEDLKKATEDHFSAAVTQTEEATQKMEEFTVSIGDTTIEFKGAAAEVVKNADAYEKLQDSAQKIMDLDWSVFTEFEASLPNIEAGIGDMESSFVGLKDILEDNIGSLENVQQSVMDISEIAAPFLEAGFLKGVKSIGAFAGTLKDAGSAINDFSSLQDVSVEGCANFSLHVRDMVSALELLESQMEDLVPSFKRMDSLIEDIQIGFLSGTDITALYGGDWKQIQKMFSNTIIDVNSANEILATTFGLTVDEIKILREESTLTTYAFLKQTTALKTQTGQLNKITEALQPYLNFMRTLNELAALSTLSTVELNSGLNSINDTLVNLGKSLESFDLRPVMESLFGTKIPEGKDLAGEFTGGFATGFTEVMIEYQTEFGNLITYVTRLSSAITGLVSAFDALADIGDSVLADQMKLKEVFGSITTVMANFSTEMGGTEGFAKKLAVGMDAMLKSAEPLIKYFQDNNAAVDQFNTTLLSFKTTIANVIGIFEALASMVEKSSDVVVISAEDIAEALSLVDDQLRQIGLYLQSDAWAEIVTELSAVSDEWGKWAVSVDESMPAFNSAVDTFSTLISKIMGLSTALKDMRDISVLSVHDIDEALKNIPVFLDRFVDALALNMDSIEASLKGLHIEWEKHSEDMKGVMPAYEDSTAAIGKLVGSFLSLHSALESLSEMGTISEQEFSRGFSSLIESISNFAVSLAKNVDELIFSLDKLRVVWLENEAVLFPLIRDFAIISDNLYGVAHNANRMAKEFDALSKNSGTLEKGFKSLIDFINQVVKATKEFYTTEAAAELAGFIEDVDKVIDAFVDLEIKLKGAMDKIKTAIGNAVDNIEGKINSLANLVISAYHSGANVMGAFITGIYSMSAALERAVAEQAMIVDDYLGASSPTRLGPLARLDEWPRNLIQSYSAGIEAEMHTLNSSFSGLAPDMGAGGVGGGNRSIVINNTQYISDRETADYANNELSRLLSRHAVM